MTGAYQGCKKVSREWKEKLNWREGFMFSLNSKTKNSGQGCSRAEFDQE